ncbi:LLM class F420-dependent oxidoreductase [Mycolicibacterium vaccae]|jgi:probable F420-dependent oxidoreductase|uniref:Putative F420-dependent oxidoreductase, MSMEG_2906 family protein n=1 Tax=Mycolicibacterium vaccae ATCC 25954 TaxID=1194972 RepID=K0UTL1_MYCVA|nr:LLM class F420-dependent oxidoreductase [Mycolicibacterium vaccae]EJZ10136.1 putative F420-dependent oxidoreductase, MSMEG_2906 family protein [Mycolicibacterium vaccae ATCC 25954]MCV7063925.1 LLM class F420-dependent oxidoreductase [Mycolicibacterium vaccae]
MARPIRVGVQLMPAGTPDYRTWRQAVLYAEELGTDVIFGYDHFHTPRVADPAENDDVQNFEGWTALASWGEITTRAEIGLLVTGIGYRNPDLLADMARTVDHISGGRVILGVGAGWYEKDYSSYGYDFGTVKSRMDLFDESLLRIENRLTRLNPAPVRKIPILIGGSGASRTLPAVARHADLWHALLPIDDYRVATARLAELADESGRPDSDIERSVNWQDERGAEEYLAAGATLFLTEIWPTEEGYDFSTLEKMLRWRDEQG